MEGFANVLLPFIIFGLGHTLLNSHLTAHGHKANHRFDKKTLHEGLIALACGVLLFFAAAPLVNVLANMFLWLFYSGPYTADIPVANSVRGVLQFLADSMIYMALICTSLLMAGATVIMSSAGKKKYIFVGSLFYILVVTMFFVASTFMFMYESAGIKPDHLM